MAGPLMGRLLVTVGVVFFLVTGYNAMSYRERIRLLGIEFNGLPGPLLANLAIASAVSIAGGLQLWGTFKPVRLADVPRPSVLRPVRQDFVHFNTREAAFLPLLRQIESIRSAKP